MKNGVVGALAAVLALATPVAAATPVREILFVGPYNGIGTNVLTIHPNGNGLRLVAANATNPRWSPDGTGIVYTSLRTDANGSVSTVGLVISAQGGERRQITSGNDNAEAWSPDGLWIAFTRYENQKQNLYVVHPDGGGLRELRAKTWWAAWAPDSRRLLIATPQGLATVDLAGRIRAVANSTCATDGAFSPDGRLIAMSRCVGRPYHLGIAVERASGSGFHWLAKPVSPQGNWGPVWSPDGTKIAYTLERDVQYLEHTEIRMVSLSGKSLGNLDSYAQNHDEYPAWSPDGMQIVFDRDAAVEPIGEFDRLYVGDVKTGRVRELYENTWRGAQSWRPR